MLINGLRFYRYRQSFQRNRWRRCCRAHVWLLLLAGALAVSTAAGQLQSKYQPHVVVVQFDPQIPLAPVGATIGWPAFDSVVAAFDVHGIERAFPFLDHVDVTPEIARNLAALRRTYYVRYGSHEDPARVARAWSAVRGVRYAEPVPVHHFFEPATGTEPNDPSYGDQTYLKHLLLPEAWDVVRGEDGEPPVIIAIVDGGGHWRHADLRANVWVNEDEVPDNKLDDDNNGFIDDVHGVNFENEDEEDNDPTGLPDTPHNGAMHGTAVAGTASAVTDNAIGVAGAAWNAELMHINVSCRHIAAACYGYEGILYAAANGADIINVSWGAVIPMDDTLRWIAQTLDLATDMGALVVAAAGNSNDLNDAAPLFPANHPRVLSVGATEKDSRIKAHFSNFGRSVKVFAPGVDIETTVPQDGYGELSGTSFAAPLVSGVAALVKTRFPDISADALREQIRLASESMDADNPLRAGQLGNGYVNAWAALQQPEVPAVRVGRWAWHDADGDGAIRAGEEVTVSIVVVNHLTDARQLTVGLVPDQPYPFIELAGAEQSVGILARDDSAEVSFRFTVDSSAPVNQRVHFHTRIREGAFVDESVDRLSLGINTSMVPVFEALKALYASTNGDRWLINDGWDTTLTTPTAEQLATWYGVEFFGGLPYRLALEVNSLSGALPDELGDLAQLQHLSFAFNQLSGEIPPTLGALSQLRILQLPVNAFMGTIPRELGNLSSLQVLDVSLNALSGEVPDTLGNLSQLHTLLLNNNALTGMLPRSLMRLTDLIILAFDGQDLCAPSDHAFQSWLATVTIVAGPTCRGLRFDGVIADQTFPQGEWIEPLVLPEASGGASPVTYALTPSLPEGLRFNANTRTISGTPTEVTAARTYTYSAADLHGSADSLRFSMEVVSPVGAGRDALPTVFALHENYPNPVRQSTHINFDLPWSAQVALEVTDLLGRRVLALPATFVAAGWRRSLRVNANALSSGLYVYRVFTEFPGGRTVREGRFIRIR